jgi:hypothetical protein
MPAPWKPRSVASQPGGTRLQPKPFHFGSTKLGAVQNGARNQKAFASTSSRQGNAIRFAGPTPRRAPGGVLPKVYGRAGALDGND